MKKICMGLILFYQKAISPLFPARCRFYPTCSQYALEAVEKYGVFKCVWISVKRNFRCNTWSRVGYDPVK